MQYSYDTKGNPVERPVTNEERVATAAKTIEVAGLQMPVLVDEIDNPMPSCSEGRCGVSPEPAL
jgi:hypothetical protein